MKLNWQISAGEFFELLRPTALVLSALLSTWVMASARRRRFRAVAAVIWGLATFFLPFVVLPIYLIVRSSSGRAGPTSALGTTHEDTIATTTAVRFRLIAPAAYGLILLSLIGIYLYRDYHGIDAHLARASQAKVMNQRDRAIREYRAALALEDDPHTHKLLGIELAGASNWREALKEFRAADRGAEPDDMLPFWIGQALEQVTQASEAVREYERFLSGPRCVRSLPDSRCEIARRRIESRPSPAAP